MKSRFSAMLVLYLMWFVGVSSQLVSDLVLGQLSAIMIFFTLCWLSIVLFNLRLCLGAAQSIQTNKQSFQQALAGLLNNSVTDETYRAIKDLLRQVSVSSVTISAGGFTLDMTLFTSSIMLCTSYTIVILQFENVV